MKINESGRLSSLQAYRNGIRANDANVSPYKRSSQKDHIRISPEAKELLEAQRTGNANRAERIAELKHSVQTGTYFVSAEKLAEKLLPYFK